MGNFPSLDPLQVSALATVVSVAVTAILAAITWFYMRESRRISVEAQRPSFGLEPSVFTIGGAFHRINLKNTGAVAKDLRIDITDPTGTTKWFAPSLSHDASLLLDVDVDEASKLGRTIAVKVNYKDAEESELETKFEIDFGRIVSEKRKPLYQGDALTEIADSLSDIRREISSMESDLRYRRR